MQYVQLTWHPYSVLRLRLACTHTFSHEQFKLQTRELRLFTRLCICIITNSKIYAIIEFKITIMMVFMVWETWLMFVFSIENRIVFENIHRYDLNLCYQVLICQSPYTFVAITFLIELMYVEFLIWMTDSSKCYNFNAIKGHVNFFARCVLYFSSS